MNGCRVNISYNDIFTLFIWKIKKVQLTLRHKQDLKMTEVIKNRMEIVGLTQAKLSESIGCTPTQLSLFLKDEASLNRTSLEKCFEILGIPLNAISKRIELAKLAAEKLSSYSIEDIAQMTRAKMISTTGLNDLLALPEVTKEEFEKMIFSGIADHESTYQYFKSLVLQFRQMPAKITPKAASTSLNLLASSLITLPFLPFLGIGTVIGAAVGALATKQSSFAKAVNNAWGPLLTLTMNLFDQNR